MKLQSLVIAAALGVSAGARADFIDLYANKLDMPQNKGPRLGKSKVLLIPVQIDYGSYAPVDMAALKAFYEQAPDDKLSFRKYFDIASNHRYTPDVTVAPLVEYTTCPAMIASGDGCTIPRGDVHALAQGMDFIRDVFRRTHDESKINFKDFDVNGLGHEADGYVDGVILVVNVPNVGIAFPIEYVNSGSNLNGGTGGALVLDGVQIPYCAVAGASFPDGKQHLEYIALHEFSHTLGLADLYYEHPASGDKYPAWGGLHFSLMGDYDYSADVALPDAESRRALGWQHHEVLSGTQTLTLYPAGDGGGSVKLGMMNGNRQEYFLAEVRGPSASGVDTGIRDGAGNPTWGLSLYHVDWTVGPKAQTGEWPSRLLYCLDCNPYHPFIRNLQSSGTFSLVSGGSADNNTATKQGQAYDDAVLWHGGAIQSLQNAPPLSDSYHYVATNYYDGTESGISIRDIKLNPDHSITATFTAPTVADPCSDVSCPANEVCSSTGASAGNCEEVSASIPDGGPAVIPPAPAGCSSTSSAGLWGALLFAGLAFALVRRRS